MLKIEIEHSGGNLFVRCQGALLVGAKLERLPELARDARGKCLVLDLRRVDRIDAHGIGVVAEMANKVREYGLQLKVVHVSAQLREVFQTCGLESLLGEGSEACSSAA